MRTRKGVAAFALAFAASASWAAPAMERGWEQPHRFGYADVPGASWDEVRAAGLPFGVPNLSVHIPVGLSEQHALLYCDCAFNAWKLDVPPDLKTSDAASAQTIQALKAEMVGIALGEAPYLPDYRQTKWTRRSGGYPVVRGELEASHRRYTFDYCTDPASGELYIHGTIRNVGFLKGKGTVRLRRANPLEKDILDYHYIGFRWNAEKWRTGGEAEPPVCTEVENAVAAAERAWSFDEKAYGRVPGFWGSPYTPERCMRLMTGGNVLKVEAELDPGQAFTFTVAAGFADRPVTKHPPFVEVVAAAERHWDGFLATRAEFADARENDVFRNLQFCNLQLLLNPWKDSSSPYLQPCQGGLSERFYVWVWEAMFSLRPMLRTGHFKPVRKVLEFILRLQDGGCPPEGDFTTLKGSIGTTGPRWTNSTGAALLLAADYLAYADDADFEQRHLDNLIRAANWILGEVKATRKLNPDGTRKLGYGLMPGCVANDGDRGLFFATNDSYSYAGVRRLADFLLRRGHPDGAAMAEECARYKADLDAAVALVQREDGFIPRVLGPDVGGSFEFRNIPGALGLVWSGAIDPAADRRLERMVGYWEREHADGPFAEPFDARIKYIGNCESGLARYHAQRGEWKLAYFARKGYMNYAMTRDLGITVERYSEADATFAPWQPNASNNGRGLDMMIDRFVLEGNSRIVLMGGFAPFERGDVSIEGLRTVFGRFSIARRHGTLAARWERPLPVGQKILVPDHLGFVPDGDALRSEGNGLWTVIKPTTTVSGRTSMAARDSGTTFARDALQKFVDSEEISGAISVLYHDGVQETACLGYANRKEKRPITLDDLFMQCSQTKGFCGVTIAMLIEEGRLKLDDPVAKYLPEFSELWVETKDEDGSRRLKKAKNILTVRHVMNHTGGFPFELANAIDMGGWSRRMPLRSVAATAAAAPLLFEPGTRASYSNVGIDIGAAIVEVVSGSRWEDYLQSRVLTPLGMVDTGFWPTDAQLKRRIELDEVRKGQKAQLRDEPEWMQRPFNGDRVFPSAGAGLWTTARDQLKFYMMLMNLGVGENGSRILKTETVKELLARSTRPSGMGGYSLGLNAPEKDAADEWFGHGGAWNTSCMVNWHKRELKLWVVQFYGDERWKMCKKERDAAADAFFSRHVDSSGVDAYTGRLK